MNKHSRSHVLAFPGMFHINRAKANRPIVLMTRILHPASPLKPFRTCVCTVRQRTWLCGEDWRFSHYEINSESEAPDALGACTSLCHERQYKGSRYTTNKFTWSDTTERNCGFFVKSGRSITADVSIEDRAVDKEGTY